MRAQWFTLNRDTNLRASHKVTLDATVEHLKKYAITIYDHVDAFKPLADKADRSRSRNAYMVRYEVDMSKVPRDLNGNCALKGLTDHFPVTEGMGQTASAFFAEEPMKKVFGCCYKCLKPCGACQGHGTKQAAPLGYKTAAERDAMARRRKDKQAKINHNWV